MILLLLMGSSYSENWLMSCMNDNNLLSLHNAKAALEVALHSLYRAIWRRGSIWEGIVRDATRLNSAPRKRKQRTDPMQRSSCISPLVGIELTRGSSSQTCSGPARERPGSPLSRTCLPAGCCACCVCSRGGAVRCRELPAGTPAQARTQAQAPEAGCGCC